MKLIAITSDDASPNRKLFQMKFPVTFDDDINSDVNVTYRKRNLHSLQEKRFLFTLCLMQDICCKLPATVYKILVMANTFGAYGKV